MLLEIRSRSPEREVNVLIPSKQLNHDVVERRSNVMDRIANDGGRLRWQLCDRSNNQTFPAVRLVLCGDLAKWLPEKIFEETS